VAAISLGFLSTSAVSGTETDVQGRIWQMVENHLREGRDVMRSIYSHRGLPVTDTGRSGSWKRAHGRKSF
jgi:hypothetical protein